MTYGIFYFILVNLIQHSLADSLPYILWDPNNEIFDSEKCPASNNINVRYGDKLPVVCGNSNLRSYLVNNQLNDNNFYHNLYVTADEDAFIHRDVNRSDHLKDCDLKLGTGHDGSSSYLIQHYDISFSDNSYFEYRPTKTYYFFTTSEGSKKEFKSTVVSPKSKHMFFTVYVCDFNKVCEGRDQINICQNKVNVLKQHGSQSDDAVVGLPVVIAFILALIIGITVGVFGTYLHRRCEKQQRCGNNVIKKVEKEEELKSIESQNFLKTRNNGHQFNGHAVPKDEDLRRVKRNCPV